MTYTNHKKKSELLYVGPAIATALRENYARFNTKTRRKYKTRLPFTRFTDLFAPSILKNADALLKTDFKATHARRRKHARINALNKI